MASTKTRTAVWDGQVLANSNALTYSNTVDLADGFGAVADIKLSNGATGPTTPASVVIQVSSDNTSDNWYSFGGSFVAGVTVNAAYSWGGIEIPMPVKYVRFVAGGNVGDGANVNVDVDVTEVTAL